MRTFFNKIICYYNGARANNWSRFRGSLFDGVPNTNFYMPKTLVLNKGKINEIGEV